MTSKENKPTIVTQRQNEYLKELDTGAKSTWDLMLSLMISRPSVSKIIKKLRDAGLVKSNRVPGVQGNVYEHELAARYEDLNIVVVNQPGGPQTTITDAEICYAGELRRAGWTGQALVQQYQKRYQYRNKSSIMNRVVIKARKKGLCR